ncbi:MAG: hypothetical protein ACFCBW_02400 [Candidatus Competibacterales bacterium]
MWCIDDDIDDDSIGNPNAPGGADDAEVGVKMIDIDNKSTEIILSCEIVGIILAPQGAKVHKGSVTGSRSGAVKQGVSNCLKALISKDEISNVPLDDNSSVTMIAQFPKGALGALSMVIAIGTSVLGGCGSTFFDGPQTQNSRCGRLAMGQRTTYLEERLCREASNP